MTTTCRTLLTSLLLLAGAGTTLAGSLEPAAAPTDPASALYTVNDLFNRLTTGATGAKRSGPFTEPTAPPGPTGHTTDEIMAVMPTADNANGATVAEVLSGKSFWGLRTDGTWGLKVGTMPMIPVAKTGQTTVYLPGDDGTWQKGVAPPTPRFTDNLNGTVTDNATGLIWLQNTDCPPPQTWNSAITSVNNLAHGACNLSDNSTAGQWRLPNVKELQSLIDYGRSFPALPADHLFTGNNVSTVCWSSTTYAYYPDYAWYVDFYNGYVDYFDKNGHSYVRCVRGGQ